jgi:hypothetical protein
VGQGTKSCSLKRSALKIGYFSVAKFSLELADRHADCLAQGSEATWLQGSCNTRPCCLSDSPLMSIIAGNSSARYSEG